MPRREVDESHKPILDSIGRRLKQIREGKNLTIEQVAKSARISRNGIALMEKGETYFNLSTLLSLLDIYQVDHKKFFKDLIL
jgi:transcriptional regulator with XRE-family HTH domain